MFLGSEFPSAEALSSRTETLALRLACFPLSKHGDGYPARLRKIYSTVYAAGALWPGTTFAGAADKVVSKVNVFTLMKLLAGTLFGKSGAQAVAGAESVLGTAKS